MYVRDIVAVVVCSFFIVSFYGQRVKTSVSAACQGANSSFLLFRHRRRREIARQRCIETNLIYQAGRTHSSTCCSNQRLDVDKKHELREIIFKKPFTGRKKKTNQPRGNIIKTILTVIDSGFVRCLERLKPNVLVGGNWFQTAFGGEKHAAATLAPLSSLLKQRHLRTHVSQSARRPAR